MIRQHVRGIFSGWFLGKLLAVAILASGAWAFIEGASSPQLRVTRVDVVGNRLVGTDEILSMLSVEGENVFLIRSPRIERRLLADPAIEWSTVEPRLPDLVEIHIGERQPAVVWDTGVRRTLADADGLGLRESPPGTVSLPVVRAPEGPEVDPGGRADRVAVRVAQAVGPRLDALELPNGWIEFHPNSGVSLVTPSGMRVALGFGDDVENKITAYQAIRGYLSQTKTPASFIDVRFHERPYFR
ncbi:MAG: cell division protein ftsQ [Chloroflexi bacterium]|nr:cell division protein ftsQ [Chloroflexota bacterium]